MTRVQNFPIFIQKFRRTRHFSSRFLRSQQTLNHYSDPSKRVGPGIRPRIPYNQQNLKTINQILIEPPGNRATQPKITKKTRKKALIHHRNCSYPLRNTDYDGVPLKIISFFFLFFSKIFLIFSPLKTVALLSSLARWGGLSLYLGWVFWHTMFGCSFFAKNNLKICVENLLQWITKKITLKKSPEREID